MLSTRQRRHSSGPQMLQFDLEQVHGFGRLGASNWEMAIVFGCCTKTIERARKQTSSGFEAAYQKGQQETTTAIRILFWLVKNASAIASTFSGGARMGGDDCPIPAGHAQLWKRR
jgi:hypothetical protein